MRQRLPQELPQTLPYHLTGEIRARIIRGTYAPGRPLREQELERTFGSSRGPIRESLLMLQKRGLVDHQPRRGFRVRLLSARELADLYRLQGTLWRALVEDLEAVDLERLAGTLDGHLAALDGHLDAADAMPLFTLSAAIDLALIDAPGDVFLRDALGALVEIASPVTFALTARADRQALGQGMRDLACAVRAGDLALVGNLIDGRVRAHAEHAAARVDGVQAAPPSAPDALAPQARVR